MQIRFLRTTAIAYVFRACAGFRIWRRRGDGAAPRDDGRFAPIKARFASKSEAKRDARHAIRSLHGARRNPGAAHHDKNRRKGGLIMSKPEKKKAFEGRLVSIKDGGERGIESETGYVRLLLSHRFHKNAQWRLFTRWALAKSNHERIPVWIYFVWKGTIFCH